MIINQDYIKVLNETDSLANMIKHSDVMLEYQQAKHALNNNNEAQNLIKRFINIKEHYDDVQRFGRYHPDYNAIMKNVRSEKRKMDMNEYVAAFKVEERHLQRFLDEISEVLAKSVSDTIIVPKDGLALTDGGCSSGGCGTGGSCGCQAS